MIQRRKLPGDICSLLYLEQLQLSTGPFRSIRSNSSSTPWRPALCSPISSPRTRTSPPPSSTGTCTTSSPVETNQKLKPTRSLPIRKNWSFWSSPYEFRQPRGCSRLPGSAPLRSGQNRFCINHRGWRQGRLHRIQSWGRRTAGRWWRSCSQPRCQEKWAPFSAAGFFDTSKPDEVRQRVVPGDAAAEIDSDRLSVSTSLSKSLVFSPEISPNPFTPNADDVNDVLNISTNSCE